MGGHLSHEKDIGESIGRAPRAALGHVPRPRKEALEWRDRSRIDQKRPVFAFTERYRHGTGQGLSPATKQENKILQKRVAPIEEKERNVGGPASPPVVGCGRAVPFFEIFGGFEKHSNTGWRRRTYGTVKRRIVGNTTTTIALYSWAITADLWRSLTF